MRKLFTTAFLTIALGSSTWAQAPSGTRVALSPVPLWPQNGDTSQLPKGQYVFYDPHAGEYVVYYAPESADASSVQPTILRFGTHSLVDPEVTFTVAPSGDGRFHYAYKVENGAHARQSIGKIRILDYSDSSPKGSGAYWTTHVEPHSEGGHGDLTDKEDGNTANDVSFSVYGQNPASGNIATYLNSLSPPWWYGHALTWETLASNPNGNPPGNVQFLPGMDPTGTYLSPPAWGKPDGFGLSQLDGSPGANASLVTDNSLWTWTTNLMYGVQVANNKKLGAASHFANQYQLMLTDTNDAGLGPMNPQPVYGYCQITTPNGVGNGSSWNADWIQYYNGGFYEYWNGPSTGSSSLGWSYNTINPTYVPNVCAQQSYTM